MPKGDTPEAQRDYTLKVRDEALQELWERKPEVQEKYNAAAGDLFLSNFSFHAGFLTLANGYGVIEDHETKERKYVRMFRFGIGPGLAIKGLYLLALIPDKESLQKVMEGSWAWGGFLEASFKFGDFGGTANLEGAAGPLEAYSWTHTGFSLELTFLGSKVYLKDALNESSESAAE